MQDLITNINSIIPMSEPVFTSIYGILLVLIASAGF